MRLWEGSFWAFFVISVLLGGGAAWVTGRAVALSWRPVWLALLYVGLLASAVRFLHFALGGGRLLAFEYYLVDVAIEWLAAGVAYRLTRAGQMTRQYRWLYRRRGPLAWRAIRPPAP